MVQIPGGFDASKVSPDTETSSVDYQYLNDQISNNSQGFVRALAPTGNYRGRNYEWLAEYRGEKNIGSAYIDLESGQWTDQGGTASGGDFISFYAFHKGLSQLESAIEISDTYGYSLRHGEPLSTPKISLPVNAPMPTQEQEDAKKKEYLNKIVSTAQNIHPDNPAGKYLISRGINLDYIDYNEIAYCRDGDYHLCAFVARGPSGDIDSIQRIYLDAEGNKCPKPGNDTAKLSLGSNKGKPFVVKPLSEENPDRLIIVEGPEDALSLSLAMGCEVWAMFGSSNLANAPATGRDVLIVADSDGRRETIDRTNSAIEVLEPLNNTVKVWYPPASLKDANAIHNKFGVGELKRLVDEALNGKSGKAEQVLDLSKWGLNKYLNDPDPIEWLVYDKVPQGVPFLIASEGGLGKSMKLLSLCMAVATRYETQEADLKKSDFEKHSHFGSRITQAGSAIFITAEDSAGTVHRRLAALDHRNDRAHIDPNRLMIVPMPDAGGAVPLMTQTRDGNYEMSWLFESIREQASRMPNLKVIAFDPMQTFVSADINKDPAAAQFFWSNIARLAAETGATIIISHHTNKAGANTEIVTPEEARLMIRGSSSIVDGARGAFVYWSPSEKKSREICQRINIEWAPKRIIWGALVKSNELADMSRVTELRNPDGSFTDITSKVEEAERKFNKIEWRQVREIWKEIEFRAREGQNARRRFKDSKQAIGSEFHILNYIEDKCSCSPEAAKRLLANLYAHELIMKDKRGKDPEFLNVSRPISDEKEF